MSTPARLFERQYLVELYDAPQIPPSQQMTTTGTVSGVLSGLPPFADLPITNIPSLSERALSERAPDELEDKFSDLSIGKLARRRKQRGPEEPVLSPERMGSVSKLSLSLPKARFGGYYDAQGRPGLYCEWDITLSIDEYSPSGELRLYNLSEEAQQAICEKDMIRLWAGYRTQQLQPLTTATILSTKGFWQGGDHVMQLTLGESATTWMSYTAWREGRPGEDAVAVIQELLSMQPLPFTFVGVGRNRIYELGKPFAQTIHVRQALDEMAADTISKVFVYDGRVYFMPLGHAEDAGVVISSAPNFRNLIGDPTPTQDSQNVGKEQSDFRVTCLLDGRLKPGRQFFLQSREYNGFTRIISMKYVATRHEFYNVMECAKEGVLGPSPERLLPETKRLLDDDMELFPMGKAQARFIFGGGRRGRGRGAGRSW